MSADGMARVRSARAVIDHYIAQGLPAYGITTMYGADFQTALPSAAMRRFGRINIIQESTRVGGGTMPPIDRGTMRAAWARTTWLGSVADRRRASRGPWTRAQPWAQGGAARDQPAERRALLGTSATARAGAGADPMTWRSRRRPIAAAS